MRLVLTEASNEGYLEHFTWAKSTNNWVGLLKIPRDRCDSYAVCGAYSICDVTTVALCQCLDRFKPKSSEDWSQSQWTKGCEHEVPINCSKGEGFRKYTSIKLPDTEFSLVDASTNLEDCRIKCLSNCSCTAYAASDIRGSGSGCIMWLKDLIDMRKTTTGGQDLYIRMAASELGLDS
ncbi:non-specific serine/threonine protein kinase [Ranunculus cassubicifolius]